jgi:glucokinase-like ROK family protein
MKTLIEKATREHTKIHNNRLVLRTIYNHGEISRADIARVTGLTRVTVSDYVTELLEEGLVTEVGQGVSAGGKPPTLLSLAENARHLIGIDLGNSQFQGAIANLRGEIIQCITIPVMGGDGKANLALVYELIDRLMAATSQPILGLGLGTPGVTDVQQGIIRRAVNVGWQDLPLQALLTARYNLPVYVANDCHVAALAEYTFGQNKNSSNLAVVKVGRGIGIGLVINGQLFYGDGFGAGEIGHVVVVEDGELCSCGNFGCLETVASSRAILKQAQQLAISQPQSSLSQWAASPESITVDQLLQAVASGDPALAAVIAQAGLYLGMAIANLVGILNIQHILIGGSLARFGQTLLEPAQQEMVKRSLSTLTQDTRLEIASLGSDIVILGAAALLLTHELGVA